MATESVDEILGILADDLINYDQRMTKTGAPNIRFVHKYVKKAKVALDAYYTRECARKTLEAKIAELQALLDNEAKGDACICQLAGTEVCDHNWSLCNVVRDRIDELRAAIQDTSPQQHKPLEEK